MTPHRFARNELPTSPWKNGAGSSQQIACWPKGATLDEFGWRASLATIAGDGPFSLFPGVDRIIALIDSDGVRLRSRDGRIDHVLDMPHITFAFSGDALIDGALLGGPSIDFNLMTRRGQWHADVQVLGREAVVAAAAHGMLLALSGSWRLGPDAWEVCAGEGLYWHETSQAWQATPDSADARLLAARIVPA